MLVEVPKAVIQKSIPEDTPAAEIITEKDPSLLIVPRLDIINPLKHSFEKFTFRKSIGSGLRGSERFRHRGGRRPRCSKCNGKHTPSVGECRGGGTLGLNPSIYTPFKIAA